MCLFGMRVMEDKRILPHKIFLEDYRGDYKRYIDAVYAVFERDFIRHKTRFGSHKLNLKYNPLFQDRAYTFYHITHTGEVESERIPDLRRCECMPWARPTIENVSNWQLKFWKQKRQNSSNRVCICLENEIDVDYFLVLEVRVTYLLLWTAFVCERSHEKAKKMKEYQAWVETNDNKKYTPDSLIKEIQQTLKARSASKDAPVTPSTHGC